jgi:hypothetical protein
VRGTFVTTSTTATVAVSFRYLDALFFCSFLTDE